MAKSKGEKRSKRVKRPFDEGDDFIALETPAELRRAKKPKLQKRAEARLPKEEELPKTLSDNSQTKRVTLLDGDGSDEEDGAASLRVNEEYASRFEHNKKREEKQRCMLLSI